jgi:alpha-galactosidase
VRLTNTGKADTLQLESLQGLAGTFALPDQRNPVLNYWNGDTSASDQYQPFDQVLSVGHTRRIAPVGGRGSNEAFPDCHVQLKGGGILLAVGWPGQWATRFTSTSAYELSIEAGQEQTRLVLKPGETVRSPSIALLFSKGDDPVFAQNPRRRWMWAHNVPRTADEALPPPLLFGNTSGQFNEMCNANEAK